jgi:hypothetical protein
MLTISKPLSAGQAQTYQREGVHCEGSRTTGLSGESLQANGKDEWPGKSADSTLNW